MLDFFNDNLYLRMLEITMAVIHYLLIWKDVEENMSYMLDLQNINTNYVFDRKFSYEVTFRGNIFSHSLLEG